MTMSPEDSAEGPKAMTPAAPPRAGAGAAAATGNGGATPESVARQRAGEGGPEPQAERPNARPRTADAAGQVEAAIENPCSRAAT